MAKKYKLLKHDEVSKIENFISLAMTTYKIAESDDIQGGHSAIVLSKKNDRKIFHWNYGGVILDDFNNDVHKISYVLSLMNHLKLQEDEIEAFESYANKIKSKSKMTFGYVSDNSKYNLVTGLYNQASELPEIGTCVTFCMNVLNGFFQEVDNYINVTDWDSSTVTDEQFTRFLTNAKINYPEMDEETYKNFSRRILPSELTASSTIKREEMPISKSQIDSLIPVFQDELNKLFV